MEEKYINKILNFVDENINTAKELVINKEQAKGIIKEIQEDYTPNAIIELKIAEYKERKVNCNDIETVLNLLKKKDKEIKNWEYHCTVDLEREITELNNENFEYKAELKKKDKIIDLMAKKLNQAYFEGDKFERWLNKIMGVQEKMDYGYVVPLIKQYFEKKVEE